MSTPAVVVDLVAVGPQDKAFTASRVEDAHITFWRFQQMKHTPFSLEPVNFPATAGTAKFGASGVRFQFPKQGDLAWMTYGKLTIPGIVGINTANGTAVGQFTLLTGDDEEPYWCNAIGMYILQEVQLVLGSIIVDKLTDVYMFLWEELSGKPGKRLTEMVGKFDTVALRQAQSRRSRVLYVPLPFSFTQSTGLAMPLASAQFNSVELRINFAQRSKCVVLPSAFPASNAGVYVRVDGSTNQVILATTIPALLADTDLQAEIETCLVYLDASERGKFAHGQFEQIMTEMQQQDDVPSYNPSSTPTETSAPILSQPRLQFNNIVCEYLWAVRQQAYEDSNDHYNFGGFNDPVTEGLLDPIKLTVINFNNQARVQQREGRFFRLVQPYQHHTNIPREFVYCWCFAIDPEDPQPSGGANQSRIDNVVIKNSLDARIFSATSTTATVFYFARSYNILRFRMGMITKRWS